MTKIKYCLGSRGTKPPQFFFKTTEINSKRFDDAHDDDSRFNAHDNPTTCTVTRTTEQGATWYVGHDHSNYDALTTELV